MFIALKILLVYIIFYFYPNFLRSYSSVVVQIYANSWRYQIMKRFFICLFIAIAILVGSAVKAEEKEPINIKADELSPELFLHGGKAYFGRLKSLERFVAVSVSVEGSAENIGLDKNLLTDYARLRFRNSFVDMKLEKNDQDNR